MKKSNIVQIPQPTPKMVSELDNKKQLLHGPYNKRKLKNKRLIKNPGLYKETKWELKALYMEYKYYHKTKNLYQLDKIIDYIGQVEYKYIHLLQQKIKKQ